MTVKQNKNKITPNNKRMSRRFANFPKLAYQHFVKITPKDTGNARKKTKLRGDTIYANYPYAEVLDDGHSRQAPKGMTEPTREYVKRLAKKTIRKK